MMVLLIQPDEVSYLFRVMLHNAWNFFGCHGDLIKHTRPLYPEWSTEFWTATKWLFHTYQMRQHIHHKHVICIGVWVVDIFSLNENIKLSPKLAIIQRQNKYLHTCTLLTLWRPSSSVCCILHTLELGRHNVNKVHVCKYLFCRWIIASLGDNLMFSLREKISTTQTPMVICTSRQSSYLTRSHRMVVTEAASMQKCSRNICVIWGWQQLLYTGKNSPPFHFRPFRPLTLGRI